MEERLREQTTGRYRLWTAGTVDGAYAYAYAYAYAGDDEAQAGPPHRGDIKKRKIRSDGRELHAGWPGPPGRDIKRSKMRASSAGQAHSKELG